jgi:hypothetical protein
MNKKITTSLLLMLLAVSTSVVYAQGQMAVGLKAGTTGFGGDFTYSVSDKFNARLSGSTFSYAMDGVVEDDPDIGYNVDAASTSFGLLVDYFPARRGFKVTGGLYYYDFSIIGDASPTEGYDFNDEKTFSAERLGSINATIDYASKIVPYAGIGFGNPIAKGSAVRVNFEIGALYTNSPQVTMEGEGMIAPTANYGPDFEDGVKDFKFYPVLNLGISYRIK